MYNIILAVEELISQKKQNIKYRSQERDQITRGIEEERQSLYDLENELNELKKSFEPQPPHQS